MLRRGLAVLILVLVVLGALAWRLDRGPIEVPFLAARIESTFDGGAMRVEVGRARIAWEGFEDGSVAPLEVLLSQVRVRGAGGTLRLRVPEAQVALPLGGLLRARLAPSRVALDAPVLRLRREADGALSSIPGQPEGEAAPSRDSLVAALRRLRITDGRLVVEDRSLGVDWVLRDLNLGLRRQEDGPLRGETGATLALAGETVPLRLAAVLEDTPRRWHIDLSLPQVHPAALAQAAPALAPLGLLDAAAALTVSATLAEDGQPLEAAATLQAGPGGLAMPEVGRVPFTALDLRLAATPRRLRLDRLALTLAPAPEDAAAPGPQLTATGQAILAEGRWRAEAALALDRARLGALDTWWPQGLAPAARGWVAANLLGGLLHDGQWQVAATAPESPSDVLLTSVSGEAALDGVAVRWHPRLPPLEDLSGTLAFTPEGITLQAQGGRQARSALRLPQVRIRLTDLGAGPLRAELRGRLTGPVADLWTLLRDPALGLMEGLALPFQDPTGKLDAEVSATVPIAGPSAPTDPLFQVAAQLTDLRLSDLLQGQALQDGDLDITFSRSGGRVAGSARLGDVPARGTVLVDLPSGPGERLGLRANATARAEAAAFATLGLDTAGMIEGPLGLRLGYERRGEAPARLTVRADFEAARLSLPLLGYAKPAGAAALAEATLRLDGAALRGIERLHATAPDLLLRARASGDAGSPARHIEILEGRVGATRFTGSVAPPLAPTEGWRVSLEGPVIDLRPLLSGAGGEPGPSATAAAAPGGRGAGPAAGDAVPLTLEARFDRALAPGGGPPLRDLRASATLAGSLPRRARLEARAGEEGSLEAILSPGKASGRDLRLEAARVGTMLAALGFAVPLEGGRLTLTATQSGMALGAPIAGTAELTDFTVRDAPAAAKLLQALTGYGLLEALSGPGLGFTRATLPFRFDDGVLSLEGARAYSASLGLTATGRIDLRQRELDLKGTVVPAYVFNALLGNLPLIGRLFSAEKGGGLFSAGFEVQGPLGDPRVSVNPLSALTPGFLRGLFDLGGEEAASTDAEPAPPTDADE